MKFPKPPPLKVKPSCPAKSKFKNVGDLDARSVYFIFSVSILGFGIIFLIFAIILVSLVMWPLYEKFGWPQLLASLTLFIFFVGGSMIGTWTGRMVINDLAKHE